MAGLKVPSIGLSPTIVFLHPMPERLHPAELFNCIIIMNKLILSTLLVAGVVFAKEHCELVERKTYPDPKYESLNIICKEVPYNDSVFYWLHLSSKRIDEIVISYYRNKLTIRNVYNNYAENNKCQVYTDTTDEYGVIIGEFENYYSSAICKRRFNYCWNKLKNLGIYK